MSFLKISWHGKTMKHNSKLIERSGQIAWEYKKVPRTAMAAPRALIGWTGVWKMIMDETMTDIRFMVFPMLKVKGEISFRDM